jgi:hypothetical protein
MKTRAASLVNHNYPACPYEFAELFGIFNLGEPYVPRASYKALRQQLKEWVACVERNL